MEQSKYTAEQGKKLTREEVRETMRMLASRRQAQTPDHTDPAWMAAAYRHIAQ